MRIIAGKFRSRQLKSPKKLAIRPTSDMLRETLFNILGPRVDGARFLDFFAGTGAVGIEAVSRGADMVVLVEKHDAAARLIAENLALLEIAEGARVMTADVLAAIGKLEAERSDAFDFVFLDPPYASERDYLATLLALEKSPLVVEGTVLIAEHRKSFSLPTSVGRWHQYRRVRQGDAALSFYSVG
jgi:16S rRNA (guanine966-N2)-methyltransferase